MPSVPATLRFTGPAGSLAVCDEGDAGAPVVFMTHSILSSHHMWDEQAALLLREGFRVVRADTRGHGASDAPPGPYAMEDLVADTVAVLDALKIERVHYLGLSLGCMSGFGLGIGHPARVASLLLCDGRADMPPAAGAMWPERIALARQQGCAALAQGTIERWFGPAFVGAHPEIVARVRVAVAATSTDGFVGCAQAITGLHYLGRVGEIKAPVTLVVGSNDGPLPGVMQALQPLIPGSKFQLIEGAGHLPNIDQSAAFNAVLMKHMHAHRSA